MAKRVESIDIIRGLTILLMIFVNDLAGVVNVPQWLQHASRGNDGMTIVDVVFPAFLFIVGISLPLAIQARRDRNQSYAKIWKHIISRVGGLVLIGILMVNTHRASDSYWMVPEVWTVLMYLGVILTWNRTPKNNKNTSLVKRIKMLKYVGLGLIMLLIFLFQSDTANSIIELRPGWWGILGLIGWGYLIATIFYIPFRKHLSVIIFSIWLIYCYDFACKAGMLDSIGFLKDYFKGGDIFGTHAAIILSGSVLGHIIKKYHYQNKKECIKWSLLYSLGLFLSGVMLHQLSPLHEMFFLDKNLATPVWGLISSAFTIWGWLAVYYVVDILNYKKWTKLIRPAGMNPLFAYIIAPVIYSVLNLTFKITGWNNFYKMIGQNFYSGIIRSLLFAILITWLTSFFKKKHIWLRL